MILVVGLPLSMVLYALAAMLDWNWFATMLGAPRIGFLQAFGLILTVSAFTSGTGSDRKEKDKREIVEIMFDMFFHIFFRFAVFAGLGWIIHFFMAS